MQATRQPARIAASQYHLILACFARFGLLIFWNINGAGEGIRTLDPNLGKVVLYP
jgi:hypothetical protein